jgi:hypothetical protein
MKLATGFVVLVLFVHCATRTDAPRTAAFTKADTLTEEWLKLDEALHHHWLQIARHEQALSEHLRTLFDRMAALQPLTRDMHDRIERQLDQLERIRITTRNMENPHVIEEHDRAQHALTADLFNLVGRDDRYMGDSNIAALAEAIRKYQDMTWAKRFAYDSFAGEYNRFLRQNYHLLADDTVQHPPPRKPLFGSALKK